MGVLLNRNNVWGPKQSISSAFFDDLVEIIRGDEKFNVFKEDINEAIEFYTYTLDYREKSKEYIELFFELVNILINNFNNIYKDRLDEGLIKIYKSSLYKLIDLLNIYLLEVQNL